MPPPQNGLIGLETETHLQSMTRSATAIMSRNTGDPGMVLASTGRPCIVPIRNRAVCSMRLGKHHAIRQRQVAVIGSSKKNLPSVRGQQGSKS